MIQKAKITYYLVLLKISITYALIWLFIDLLFLCHWWAIAPGMNNTKRNMHTYVQ